MATAPSRGDEMTDYIGTEEPTRSDQAALEPPAPVVPIAAGASGAAAPAVIAGTDPLGELSVDAEPLADTAEPHAHDDDGHAADQPSMLDRWADAVRGLVARGDKGPA